MFWTGSKQKISQSEYDYYKKWIWLTEFDIKPYELELIAPEDLNALWAIHEYKQERAQHDAFKKGQS